MNFDKNKNNIQIAAKWLSEKGYGIWLTGTRERSDPAVKSIFGTTVIGTGLYLVGADGKAYLIANAIDAQEGRDSGVFDEVFTFSGNFEEVAKQVISEKFGPSKLLCMNYSPTNAFADGMKLGFWKKLTNLFPEDYDFRTSEELFELLDLS